MANLLPHVDLYFPGTSKVMAKLFFRTTLATVQFKEDPLSPLSLTPICFLYLEVFYWIKGKPFLFNNELMQFEPDEVNCLDWIAYRQMYREILFTADIVDSLPASLEKPNQSDDMIDAMGAHIRLHTFDEYKYDTQLEKKIIDKLDLPALENSLNEAVRIENYEAAAHIRDKIESKNYVIFESKGRLLIRRPQPPKGDSF